MIQNGQPAGVPDAADILRSIGEAAYDWRLDSDALVWSPHAATLLGAAPAEIASGRAFAAHVEAEAGQSRADDLQQARHLDARSVLRHAEATGGNLAAWCVGWVSPPDTALEAYARAAGSALRLAAIVRRLGLDAARGALYVPIEDLQRFDIKAHQILSRSADLPELAAYQALMRHQHARVRELLARARDLCPARLPLSCSALPIWLDLEERRLALVAGQRYAVLNQIITLTPLQITWHAGRSRWRWRRALRQDRR